MKKYDLIVLGGGAGGLTVAAGAASMGASVALIEKEEQPGGDCLHFGCVPSKAFITAAKTVKIAKMAARDYGFSMNGEPDFAAAMNRVRAAIADIQKHDDADRFRELGVDVYHGFGRFEDQHTIRIDDTEVLFGKRIVISTGSRPVIPKIEGLFETGFLTNETVFNLTERPHRLAVIGGGPIGLELAQAFARFGSQVTVLEFSPKLFGREDEEIVPYVQAELENELALWLNAKVHKAELLQTGEKQLTVLQNGEQRTLCFDEILVAAGRRPNTDRIGLERAGVRTEQGNIVVNDALQTSKPHIFAVGDVLRAFPFTHAAGMEGKIAAGNAVLGLKRKINYDNVPWVTFTDPEVFHLGWTEKEARERLGDEINVYSTTLDDVDRFVADREKNGIVKMITDKKGKIVGAHAVGKNAGDWMQEVVYAKQFGYRIGSISHVIHPYPTHGAALQRTADQYWRKKLFEGLVPKLMKRYIRWFR